MAGVGGSWGMETAPAQVTAKDIERRTTSRPTTEVHA